jgi:TRAP-type uncharacterized transport system substrate-binding protein
LLADGQADLVIVQLDALRYVTDVVKAQIGIDILEKMKVVLNLCPEEIHILSANKEITSFYHLEGKRVSVGLSEGGSAEDAPNPNAGVISLKTLGDWRTLSNDKVLPLLHCFDYVNY